MLDGTQEKQKICIWTKYVRCCQKICPLQNKRFMGDIERYLCHQKGLNSANFDGHTRYNPKNPVDDELDIAMALKPLDDFPGYFGLYERLYGFIHSGRIVMARWFCEALCECYERWKVRCH